MLKTFLPKAFRSERTPSNQGFFHLENWIQNKIQDGTIDLGLSETSGELTTQTLTDPVVITLDTGEEDTLRFDLTDGSNLVIGHTNGEDADLARAYVSVNYESLSFGVYDGDTEAISSSIGINTEDDPGTIRIESSFGNINIDAPEGTLNLGVLQADLGVDPRSFLILGTDSVTIGVANSVDVESTISIDDAGEISIIGDVYFNNLLHVGTYDDTARDALTPDNGAIIYNSEYGEFQGYVSGNWLKFSLEQAGIDIVAYNDLNDLLQDNALVPDTKYLIEDAGDSGEPGVLVTALTSNTLSPVAVRYMLIPLEYDPSVDGFLGVWNSTLTPSEGEYVVWGGYVWRNANGNVGVNNNDYDLDGEWTRVEKDDDDASQVYLRKTFPCLYDVENNWIYKQWDIYGNVFGCSYQTADEEGLTDRNPVNMSDWRLAEINGSMFGNECIGVWNNRWDFGNSSKIYGNRLTGYISNNLVGSVIKANIGRNISENLITDEISDNILSSDIVNNSNDGYIYGNQCIEISNNSNDGNIDSNFLLGSITGNSNVGDILHNVIGNADDNLSNISDNSNAGSIAGNTCSRITENGPNVTDITYNANNGIIDNNNNIGQISKNSNNGNIANNASTDSDPVNIQFNINNGDISGTWGSDVEDTVVDKT